jgi:hypothetical protein
MNRAILAVSPVLNAPVNNMRINEKDPAQNSCIFIFEMIFPLLFLTVSYNFVARGIDKNSNISRPPSILVKKYSIGLEIKEKPFGFSILVAVKNEET